MPITRNVIEDILHSHWKYRGIKLDWFKYENLIDAIYHSELSATDKNLASMEALDAFTKRGHFDPKNYLTQPEKGE